MFQRVKIRGPTHPQQEKEGRTMDGWGTLLRQRTCWVAALLATVLVASCFEASRSEEDRESGHLAV